MPVKEKINGDMGKANSMVNNKEKYNLSFYKKRLGEVTAMKNKLLGVMKALETLKVL